MKILLTLILISMLSVSFRPETQEKWIGTFDMYLDEQGDVVIYYRGNIPQCMGKKVIDFVYEDCDTVQYSMQDVEKALKVKMTPVDTCPRDNHPIKTIRM
jgi:hypothetical protein